MIGWLRCVYGTIKDLVSIGPRPMSKYDEERKQRIDAYYAREEKLETIAKNSFQQIARLAIDFYDESQKLLQDAPWVIENAQPAADAARQWVECPCEKHAQLAHDVAVDAEKRADKADTETTTRGDWWSYDCVNRVHDICKCIAIWSGLPDPDPEYPTFCYTRTPEDKDSLAKDMAGLAHYFVLNPWRKSLEALDAIIDKEYQD